MTSKSNIYQDPGIGRSKPLGASAFHADVGKLFDPDNSTASSRCVDAVRDEAQIIYKRH